MSDSISYCLDCGRQVLGAVLCQACNATVMGLRAVPCRECGTSLYVRDIDEADVNSLVCDPCTRYLLSEQMSEREAPEFPMGEFPTGREYLEPEEDFWVRGYDSPFTGGFDGADELYDRPK